MKPKKLSTKMVVRKETIVNLEVRQLDEVKGGTLAETYFCTSCDPIHMCDPCER